MQARRMLWIPSCLLGVAAAAALATGAGLLLYDDQGMLRAGMVLAAVNIGSIGAGLAGVELRESESGPHAGGWWLGFLLSLLGAAAFAVAWEAMDSFEVARGAQGVGLAITSALPAYFAAGTWARLRALETLLATGPLHRHTGFGAAAGFVVGTGLVVSFLGRPVWAVTAFLLAMVLASAGARLHVWILDRVPRLVRSVADPDRIDLRFEEWRTAVPESRTRVVRDGDAARTRDPPPPGDWREGVATTLHDGRPILFVGAGSWFDPADGRVWRVYEPSEGVMKLAVEGFGWGEDLVAASPVPAGEGWLVVADSSAVPLIRLSALREAGAHRVWIGGPPGSVPEPFLAEAQAAGHGVGRYRSAVAGVAGPPRVTPRADELWCLEMDAEPPESVIGMVAVPLPGEWAAEPPEPPRAEPELPGDPSGAAEGDGGEVP